MKLILGSDMDRYFKILKVAFSMSVQVFRISASITIDLDSVKPQDVSDSWAANFSVSIFKSFVFSYNWFGLCKAARSFRFSRCQSLNVYIQVFCLQSQLIWTAVTPKKFQILEVLISQCLYCYAQEVSDSWGANLSMFIL